MIEMSETFTYLRDSDSISKPIDCPCFEVAGTEGLGQIFPDSCVLPRNKLIGLGTEPQRALVVKRWYADGFPEYTMNKDEDSNIYHDLGL